MRKPDYNDYYDEEEYQRDLNAYEDAEERRIDEAMDRYYEERYN